MGVGIGLLASLGAVLIFRHLEDQATCDRVMGLGSLAMNVGGIIFVMLGGWLADISWQTIFLGHLAGIVLMIIVLIFLPSSYGVIQEKPADNSTVKKARLPLVV